MTVYHSDNLQFTLNRIASDSENSIPANSVPDTAPQPMIACVIEVLSSTRHTFTVRTVNKYERNPSTAFHSNLTA